MQPLIEMLDRTLLGYPYLRGRGREVPLKGAGKALMSEGMRGLLLPTGALPVSFS